MDTSQLDTAAAAPHLGSTVAGEPGRDGFAALELALGLLPDQHRIIVNGQDLTRSVRRFSVHVDNGGAEWPVLLLELRSGVGEITGPGIVQVFPSEGDAPATVSQAVAEWLEALDPTVLDQALLAGGMGSSPGEAALAVLARLARASS